MRPYFITIILVVFVAAALFATITAQEDRPAADLIVTHAKVWTGDRAHPSAEAVAVIGDRIVAVGADAAVAAWRGPNTQIVDAGGRRVVPGFNDAHVHFVDGGQSLDNIALKDTASQQAFAARIGERAKRSPGEWITGGEWDDQHWTPPELPTRQLVDPLTPSTPVFVSRYDGHMALANTIALKLAGVTAQTQDPPGGTIVRDAKGNPTGVLKDAAMGFVFKVIPPMTREQRTKAVKGALAHAASLGLTSVQDMNPSYDDVAVYMDLAERGELTLRIYAAPMETGWEDQAKVGIRRAFGPPTLRLGALKGYADGSLGSTTAYFFEPYTDAPNTRGLLSDEMQPIDGMRQRMIGADRAGLQLCIHAIGDAAISQTLDLFGDVVRANGERDRRFRIEHAQHVAPKDFDRFATLGVIASVQPYHAIDDGRWAERRIGPVRIKTTYAFRTFFDRGVRLALGSDWTVAPLNPMLTLYAATTRATLDGRNPGGWVPEQKISIEEALTAYTSGSAYAEFQERQKGMLARGLLADLVVLSDDILAMPAEKIKDVTVEKTILGGRVVFSR